MASSQASHHASTPGQHRRLLPIGLTALVCAVTGALWMLGSGPVADAVTQIASIPRWVVQVGTGMVFVTVTTVALQAAVRRHADRWDAAAMSTDTTTPLPIAGRSRDRLPAAALSATASAVVITGIDGTIEWVNPAFEAMSGYPSSVAVGATPGILNSGLQDEAFFRDLWETIIAGKVWRGQLVNRRSDGELYTESQTITPVVGERGEVKHFVAISEDISERVRAEHALEMSRLRLQSLFEHAIDAIVLADDEGHYIEVNPAVSELTGYTRDELLRMQPADLATPDQQPADVATQFDDFMRAGSKSGAFALRHKDGRVVETEYRTVSNIQPGVHLSVLRDVTTRNRMLRALALAENEFRELAEKAADIVAKLHVDTDGLMQIDYINPAASTILGYPREHFYHDPDLLLTLFHGRSEDLEDALDLLPTPAEPTRLATVRLQRADGRLAWLEVHSTLVDPTTTPVTVQLVARDVTARSEMMEALEQALTDQLEAAEQLRTLNAMTDSFLQNVSHELRTPLTSILGFAQLLANPRYGLSPEDTQDFHRRILTNAQRLQRLLDDLLDVNRFTRGHLEPTRMSTDLTVLIESTVDALQLGDHPVELDLEPITMSLDAPWVGRIVTNLLRNVVQHTGPETHIWIRTRATDEGAELTIDDDGPGIPDADRQRIIEPFQQGPAASSSAQPGTGVGLSLVSSFAQAHGGTLTISERPTGGARFTVTLANANTNNDATSAGPVPRPSVTVNG